MAEPEKDWLAEYGMAQMVVNKVWEIVHAMKDPKEDPTKNALLFKVMACLEAEVLACKKMIEIEGLSKGRIADMRKLPVDELDEVLSILPDKVKGTFGRG